MVEEQTQQQLKSEKGRRKQELRMLQTRRSNSDTQKCHYGGLKATSNLLRTVSSFLFGISTVTDLNKVFNADPRDIHKSSNLVFTNKPQEE